MKYWIGLGLLFCLLVSGCTSFGGHRSGPGSASMGLPGPAAAPGSNAVTTVTSTTTGPVRTVARDGAVTTVAKPAGAGAAAGPGGSSAGSGAGSAAGPGALFYFYVVLGAIFLLWLLVAVWHRLRSRHPPARRRYRHRHA